MNEKKKAGRPKGSKNKPKVVAKRPGKSKKEHIEKGISKEELDLVDKNKVKELLDKGVHQRDIARVMNCSQQNISYILKKVKEQESLIKDFNSKESDIWDYHRAQMLANLSQDTLAKVAESIETPRDLYYYSLAKGINADKSALLKGKATVIFSIQDHSSGLSELEQMQKELIDLTQDNDGTWTQDIVVQDDKDIDVNGQSN